MAALAWHGVAPSEFRSLKPGDARELLDRLEKREAMEREAKVKLEGAEIKALVHAISNVAKTVQALRKDIAKRPTL